MYALLGPSVLAYRDSSGIVVGCKSACFANLSGNSGIQPSVPFTIRLRPTELLVLANSPDCCTGSFNTPATCPASGVEYYHYFSKPFIRSPDISCLRVCLHMQRTNARILTHTLMTRAADLLCGLATLTSRQTTPLCFAHRYQT
jgi:hypothetical protein